ncbi:hypothetical protein [Muricoccus aerilatus]|uniref:hypothetical protein n=1 Tax=Muricoccus aerilatus TaxID=452982 RepID=UPI0038CD8CCD
MHLATDTDTGRIVASVLTGHDADDGEQVGALFEKVGRPVASFTADGAYDRDDVHVAIMARHPEAEIIVPPRSSAVPSASARTAPTVRDRHLADDLRREAMPGKAGVSGSVHFAPLTGGEPIGQAGGQLDCALPSNRFSKPRLHPIQTLVPF